MVKIDVEQLLRLLQHGRSKWSLERSTRTEDLEGIVREAADWCGTRCAAPGAEATLRPATLAPTPLPSNRWCAVDSVACERHRLLLGESSAAADWSGRFLLFFPDATLSDGAAQAESAGFFDVDNVPPYGTWIAYFDERSDDVSYGSYLICWVPETLMGAAGAGIAVNPEECIQWLDESWVAVRPAIQALELPGIAAPR